MSVRKAAALAIAQLGVAAFFIAGVTGTALGESAAWFVLAATVLAAFVRAIDIESWALLIPGGFVSRVTQRLRRACRRPRQGRGTGRARAARRARLCRDRPLRGQRVGHRHCRMALHRLRAAGGSRDAHRHRASSALLWLPTRIGRDVGRDALARAVWIGVAILLVTIAWGVVTVARGGVVVSTLAVPPPVAAITPWAPLDVALAILLGFALTLPVVGGGEALARAAHELPPPRVQALRRTGLLTVLFAGVDDDARDVPRRCCWCPRASSRSGRMRRWPASRSTWPRRSAIRVLMAVALAGAAVLDAGSGRPRRARRRRADAPSRLDRRHAAVGSGVASQQVRHARSRGRRHGRGDDPRGARERRPGGLAVARLRHRDRRDARADDRVARPAPARAPGPDPVQGARQRPARAAASFRWACSPSAIVVAASALAMVLTGDVAAIATLALIALLSALVQRGRAAGGARREFAPTRARFDLLLAAELSPDQIEARPGNVLVPVRNPHLLAHVAAALQTLGRSRRRRHDGAAARRRRQRGERRPDHADAVRAAAALGRRRAGRAGRPSRPAADRPDAQRRRRHRRHRRSACARRTSTSANRRRCRPRIRRACSARRGSAPTSPKRSTFGSSSITAAAGPTPITSAPIRHPSLRAISI